MAELNCPLILTMDVCYHYTNAACIYYIKMNEEDNIFMKDALWTIGHLLKFLHSLMFFRKFLFQKFCQRCF